MVLERLYIVVFLVFSSCKPQNKSSIKVVNGVVTQDYKEIITLYRVVEVEGSNRLAMGSGLVVFSGGKPKTIFTARHNFEPGNLGLTKNYIVRKPGPEYTRQKILDDLVGIKKYTFTGSIMDEYHEIKEFYSVSDVNVTNASGGINLPAMKNDFAMVNLEEGVFKEGVYPRFGLRKKWMFENAIDYRSFEVLKNNPKITFYIWGTSIVNLDSPTTEVRKGALDAINLSFDNEFGLFRIKGNPIMGQDQTQAGDSGGVLGYELGRKRVYLGTISAGDEGPATALIDGVRSTFVAPVPGKGGELRMACLKFD